MTISPVQKVSNSIPFSRCAIKHPDGFITLKECPHEKLYIDNEDEKLFVLLLKDGVVVNEGGIVTAEGKILKDTETYLEDQQGLLKFGRNISEENPIYYEGKLAVLSSPGSENWYHWLLQVVPRLKILQRFQVKYDQIYINNLKFPWQKESLRLALNYLGIDEKKLFCIEGDVVIQAATLIVSSIPYIPSLQSFTTFPSWLKTFLHECYLFPNRAPTSPKIFISRSQATVRKIVNELALSNLLKNYGFEIVHLEKMAVKEQASLFNQAKVIVGPHGSGFTNLIFCKPGTKVIEIDHALPGKDQRSFYKLFSELLNCPYIPFYTDVVQEEELEKDLEIDLVSFLNFIKTKG